MFFCRGDFPAGEGFGVHPSPANPFLDQFETLSTRTRHVLFVNIVQRRAKDFLKNVIFFWKKAAQIRPET